jgi:hypothetical protein
MHSDVRSHPNRTEPNTLVRKCSISIITELKFFGDEEKMVILFDRRGRPSAYVTLEKAAVKHCYLFNNNY